MKPYKPIKLISKDDIQKALPSRKNTVTDEIVEIINRSQTEPEFQGESLLQTATTYEQVLTKNKASIKQYLNAIRFCSYLLSCDDNFTEAYKKTFYDTDFVKERLNLPTDDVRYAELTSAASRYRRSKLVVDLLTVSQVPFELMFNGMRYKAVAVLGDLMTTAKLDRDKINAAKELLAATKSEQIKIDFGVEIKESSAVTSMMEQLTQAAAKQAMLLETGTTSLTELGALKPKEEVLDAEVE